MRTRRRPNSFAICCLTVVLCSFALTTFDQAAEATPLLQRTSKKASVWRKVRWKAVAWVALPVLAAIGVSQLYATADSRAARLASELAEAHFEGGQPCHPQPKGSGKLNSTDGSLASHSLPNSAFQTHAVRCELNSGALQKYMVPSEGSHGKPTTGSLGMNSDLTLTAKRLTFSRGGPHDSEGNRYSVLRTEFVLPDRSSPLIQRALGWRRRLPGAVSLADIAFRVDVWYRYDSGGGKTEFAWARPLNAKEVSRLAAYLKNSESATPIGDKGTAARHLRDAVNAGTLESAEGVIDHHEDQVVQRAAEATKQLDGKPE